jgi:hypothetical protein
MFCDLVGSTPLSGRYDPEDLREIVGAYHRCVADAVAPFAGFVAKYMGDGVLIYFGYPEAHEDDAERAVRAGLAVIDAVGGLTTPEPLNVRLGIASGIVVVGDLIIAESTRRQIGALFDVEDLGPRPPVSPNRNPPGVWLARAASSVASKRCGPRRSRWLAATRNSTRCYGAGNRRNPAKGGWC